MDLWRSMAAFHERVVDVWVCTVESRAGGAGHGCYWDECVDADAEKLVRAMRKDHWCASTYSLPLYI